MEIKPIEDTRNLLRLKKEQIAIRYKIIRILGIFLSRKNKIIINQ